MLALPPSHPFWTSTEEAYPSSTLPLTLSLPRAGHIATRLGGHTFVLSSGQAAAYPMRHGAEKYSKLAYSSAFGYSVPTGAWGLEQHAPDSTLALSDEGGERWRVRRTPVEPAFVQVEAETEVEAMSGSGTPTFALKAGWNAWPDVQVLTYLLAPQPSHPHWHFRAHRITSTRAGGTILSSDGAFAIHAMCKSDHRLLPLLDNSKDDDTPIPSEARIESAGRALAASKAGAVGVVDLTPSRAGRRGSCILADASSNIVEPRTTIPSLLGEHPAQQQEQHQWIVTAIFAAPAQGGKDASREDWIKEWEDIPSLPAWLAKLVQGS